MIKGRVKWFSEKKGYGFITDDTDAEDVFVHYSAIQMNGYKNLRANQEVTFIREQTSRGFCAKEVIVS